MRFSWVGILGLMVTTSGCATLERGASDQVAVISEPPGAVVTTSLGTRCTTPCSLDVSRTAEFTVTVAKTGYAAQMIAVRTRIAGAGAAGFAANIVTAGLGGAVDIATGATLEHVPNPVSVTLRPVGRAADPKPRRSPVS